MTMLTVDQNDRPVCCVRGCGVFIPRTTPTPVCREHGLQIAREYADVLAQEQRVERARRASAVDRRRPAEDRRAGRQVIYYVRLGGYIKIGYTERLRSRLTQLRATRDDLLAIEDGDRMLEAARHDEFRGDRVHARRENFRPSEALLTHIDSLGGRDSLPSGRDSPTRTWCVFVPHRGRRPLQ